MPTVKPPLSMFTSLSVFVYQHLFITVPGYSLHKGAVYLTYPSVLLCLSWECLCTPSCFLALSRFLLSFFSLHLSFCLTYTLVLLPLSVSLTDWCVLPLCLLPPYTLCLTFSYSFTLHLSLVFGCFLCYPCRNRADHIEYIPRVRVSLLDSVLVNGNHGLCMLIKCIVSDFDVNKYTNITNLANIRNMIIINHTYELETDPK